jgi:putative sterol carrier protein
MSYFNRVGLITGRGAVVGSDGEIPTPDVVAANMDRIKSLDGGEEFHNATAALTPMLDAFSPEKKEADADTDAGLTVQKIFDGIPEAFQAEKAAGLEVVFQFDISGPDGGSWHVIVKDGGCEVAEGSHGSPTTTIKMADSDFVSLISGELNAMSAYTSGKIKIEGDLMKSQLIEKLFKF